jgi:hemerythrin superfamily protein
MHPMSDIYQEIKIDHDRHRALLDTIEDTSGDSAKRNQAWNEFFHDVKAHAAAEEETFYSKLISKTWGQDAARHSVAEHKELDDLMEELHEMDMAHGSWLQKFKTFKHDYLHHIEEEEDELFTRAKEVIPESEIKGYGERFRTRKKEEAGLVEKKREDQLED